MKFDLHYFFTPKYARWIVLSLIGLFSLLILIEIMSYFFTNNLGTALSLNNTDSKTSTKQETQQSILTSSLFGVYVPDNLNAGSVKQSNLNLTVVGIMYADKIEESQVIIRSASGEEKTYKMGDIIPGGVKIERITSSAVLVEHDGSLESLSLPKNNLRFENAPAPLQEE